MPTVPKLLQKSSGSTLRASWSTGVSQAIASPAS